MANMLTGIRLLLVVPVAWALAFPNFMSAPLLLVLITVGILTDYFDGIVARAANMASAKGQLFDHCTDFFFVAAGLTGAANIGLVSPILPLLIAIAFSQYVLDSYFLFKQKQLRMSFLGRWNGIFYFLPLIMISVSRLESVAEIQENIESIVALVDYLLIVSTVASIIDRGLAPLRE